MGYNLQLLGSAQGDHATRLCCSGGWAALCEWLDSLPGDYPAAREFSARGEFRPSADLADQVERAFAARRPADADVAHTVEGLLDLLGGGDAGETARVVADA